MKISTACIRKTSESDPRLVSVVKDNLSMMLSVFVCYGIPLGTKTDDK